MLPIADAFHHCHKTERIQLVALSGTSAGSLCAGLIAADCDFAELRTLIRESGDELVGALTAGRAADLVSIANATTFWGRTTAMWRARTTIIDVLGLGHSVLNEDVFQDFLKKMFGCCAAVRGNVTHARIEDLTASRSMALTIIKTNLVSARGVECSSGRLLDTMRDSCALPVAFRSFRDLAATPFVDGGLSDNLPIECLRANRTAPIFAVFPREADSKKPLTNIFAYLLALLSAGIDSNVNRAKEAVEKSFHVPVDVAFSTFEFAKAVTLLSDADWYSNVRETTIRSITDFAETYGNSGARNRYRFTDAKAISDYEKVLDRVTADYAEYADHVSAQMIVRVVSDRRTPAPGEYRPADVITKTSKLKAKSDKFCYYRAALEENNGAARPSLWKARNNTQDKELDITVLSLPRGGASKEKTVLMELASGDGGIRADDEVVVFDTYHIKDAMIEMNSGRPEHIILDNGRDYALSMVEVVLKYPEALGEFTLEYNVNRSKGVSGKTETFIPNNEFPDDNIVVLGLRCYDVQSKAAVYCDVVPRV